MKIWIFISLVCSLLLAACSNPAPVQRSIPSSTFPSPTVTVTPTTSPYGLKFVDIPEQIAFRGETFLPVDLYGFLLYRKLPADQMTWSAISGEHLEAGIQHSVVTAALTDDQWYGTDTITVKACETANACTEQVMTFSRLDENVGDRVRVTFIGNSGFLISAGGTKVLIDAFFEGFEDDVLPEYVLDYLLNAKPPFDNVDLILATHDHADHFSASMVARYLQNNPSTVFISTSQAAGQLTGFGGRVIALDPRSGTPEDTEVRGIQVKAIYISHGTPPAGTEETYNNGYIVSMNGVTFFHCGDINDIRDVVPYHLNDLQVDIAFITHFYFMNSSSRDIFNDSIVARYLLPIHYWYTTPEINLVSIHTYFPDAVVFHSELESWIMP
jgi:L-ascorbate metabolism protein UlaG (beta-lactamase superfamily)